MAGTIGSAAANPKEAERLWSARAQSLHEREITFAALARIAPVGILRFDAEGRCNYVNRRWQEITGFTIDEAIGEGWLERCIRTIARTFSHAGLPCALSMNCFGRNTDCAVAMVKCAGFWRRERRCEITRESRSDSFARLRISRGIVKWRQS